MSTNMDIDKSLDEIMKDKPKARRGGRRGGAPTTGARARYATTVPKAAPKTAAAPKPVTVEAIKIIISNLPQDVTEAAVRDLMQSTVGPVRTVQMSYNATGKSTGQATVVFKNKGDANKAHAACLRPLETTMWCRGGDAFWAPLGTLDWRHSTFLKLTTCCGSFSSIGQYTLSERPMKVEIAIDLNQAQSLASRVAPAAPARSGTQPRGGRGGRGGRGAAKPRAPRPVKKTAEELDAEMAAYKTDAA